MAQEAENEFIPVPPDDFFKARVVEIIEEGQTQSHGEMNPYQELRLEILSGQEEGKTIELIHGGNFTLQESQRVKEGQWVSLRKTHGYEGVFSYYIAEAYRLNQLRYVALGFLLLVFGLAGWRGLASLGGLAFSLFVIIKWTLPQILAGKNPFWVSLISTLVIALVTLYLAHGFKRRTTVALGGTLITVLIALLLGTLVVNWLGLSGAGTETAFNLQLSGLEYVNLKGLLLGGMIIGTLGVLDDVTTTQAATVDELYRANPKFTQRELYQRGMAVGREHIVSIINTLVLAYAGASLALLLLFSLNAQMPLWAILNNEAMLEEILRTLIGSSALLFAVPITTSLAAWALKKEK